MINVSYNFQGGQSIRCHHSFTVFDYATLLLADYTLDLAAKVFAG
ncbi:MAG: hypothetical protein M2R45_01470 [Verrucomicrobia subdivision 3 bacterium]|nr:hypothetical protein [Limisphaerales bacterium]MCS1413400.1 hypothetical protein [Limisphaerales bacterium]